MSFGATLMITREMIDTRKATVRSPFGYLDIGHGTPCLY